MDTISIREIKRPLIDIINANIDFLDIQSSKLSNIIQSLKSDDDANDITVLIFCLIKEHHINQLIKGNTGFGYRSFVSRIKTIAYDVASKLIKIGKFNISSKNKTKILQSAIINRMPITLIKLMLKYGANPNIPNDSNSNYIGVIMEDNYRYGMNDLPLIKILLKYGANPLFNCEEEDYVITPLYRLFSIFNEDDIVKLVCRYSETFIYLTDIIDQFHDDCYARKIIYNHILDNGMLDTLQYLNDDNIKIYNDFVLWLESIKQVKSFLTRDQLYSIYYPTQKMRIKTRGDPKLFSMIRKITLFKYNLECMIGLPIIYPRYKYYDHVMIMMFLMQKPRLINLNSDVLKLICYNLFC